MKKESAKKSRKTTIFLAAIFLLGVSLLLYPILSEYWNSLHQSQAIAAYMDAVEEMDSSSYEAMRNAAKAYNAALPEDEARFHPGKDGEKEYEDLLDITGTGIMGYVEIPGISVSLPIYHGTDDDILQIAIGHIEGSSLPVGGPGTHCVISGHRGLPSSKLFTDLDQMTEGDIFMLRVLDETLTYEVDQIRIVEPDDLSLLALEEGKDDCTLVTCTPYGVNSHRLLVRGHRIENQADGSLARITADAVQMDPRLVAMALAVPVLLLLLLGSAFHSSGKGK